jgi:hypothetical protein
VVGIGDNAFKNNNTLINLTLPDTIKTIGVSAFEGCSQLTYVYIGKNVSERELIRRQIECAHDFIMSIEGKIVTDTSQYNGYFTKYILERTYDKVIEWIMFNHITINQLYIQDKQDTILNLIYALPITDDFKTPEFKARVENWVKELIERLVNVKTLYGYNSGDNA